MDLNIPGEILSIHGANPLMLTARANFGGVIREISLAHAPLAQIGDYVLVYSGFAVGIMDDEEAKRILTTTGNSDEPEYPDDDLPT